jgi:integrase
MTGSVKKICGCRSEDGKQLGARCPKLGRKGHGSWMFVVDTGRTEDGERKQLKRAGFRTKAEAEAALEKVVGDVRVGRRIDDKKTVAQELDDFLAEKSSSSGVSASGRVLRASTRAVYAQHIRDYLKPELGPLQLTRLSSEDIAAAYRRILAKSAATAEAADRQAEILREIEVRQGGASKRRPPARRVGPTTLRRIHACLSSALNAAVKARRLSYNPAIGVDLPAANRPQVKPWEPAELGAFLDHVQTHRMGALFEVIAAGGLRRGEALGLRWSDVDLEEGIVIIRQQLLDRWDDGPVFGPPKTKAGEHRRVELDSQTLGSLIAHRFAQDAERAEWLVAYEDFDLVFCQQNGRPYDPSAVTKTFSALAAAAGLRHIRLHDLRHGAASLMLAAGIPIEIVSKRLGHSSIGITMDTYSHMLEGVGRRAAEAAMGLVPRAPKLLGDNLVTTSPPETKKGTTSDAEKVPLTSGDVGAPRGNRTPNPLIKSQLLCQLS